MYRGIGKTVVTGFTAALSLAAISLPAAGNDLRVMQLESEVRRLQRQLDAQARRIEALERGARTAQPPSQASSDAVNADSSPAWLIRTNWDRVQIGMKVPEVVALLGRPTSVRTDSAGRLQSLWYAMEIGPSTVISGNVQVTNEAVAQINAPILR